MPPRLQGSFRVRDGQVYLRVRGREWLAGPRSLWPDSRIKDELDRVVSAVKAGEWSGPPRPVVRSSELPCFEDVAADFLDFMRRSRAQNTAADAEHRIAHLNGYFGETRVDQITARSIEGFIVNKQQERDLLAEVRRKRKAGEELSESEAAISIHRQGLTDRGINRCVAMLGSILDRAIRDHPDASIANPARDRHLRLRSGPRALRNRLTMDQLDALLAAAQKLETTGRANYHNLGRPAMLATLALGGLRTAELLALRRKHLLLEDRVIQVVDAKTPTGVREVAVSEHLAGFLQAWVARTPAAGGGEWLFPSATGGARDSDRFRDRILRRSGAVADKTLDVAGKLALPSPLTPYTLRRTYATFSLVLNRSLPYVMGQMGHRDSRMLLEIYGQSVPPGEAKDPRVKAYYGVADEL